MVEYKIMIAQSGKKAYHGTFGWDNPKDAKEFVDKLVTRGFPGFDKKPATDPIMALVVVCDDPNRQSGTRMAEIVEASLYFWGKA